jgi:Domain of unknown function (DUF397)
MTEWRKSSRSGTEAQSDCVEMAQLPGAVVGVRDSKDQYGARISLPVDQARALVAAIKRGDHDTP